MLFNKHTNRKENWSTQVCELDFVSPEKDKTGSVNFKSTSTFDKTLDKVGLLQLASMGRSLGNLWMVMAFPWFPPPMMLTVESN